MYIEGVREWGAEGNVWSEGAGSNRRLERIS
jgi:hypothetical protein